MHLLDYCQIIMFGLASYLAYRGGCNYFKTKDKKKLTMYCLPLVITVVLMVSGFFKY